jgi:methylmalonyl-CoA mutase C-terminal domain/subunit
MLRIVIGQPGPDDESQAVAALARRLRDAGHEVIHAGRQEEPEPLAEAAVQEDADLVALVLTDPDDDGPAARVRQQLAARGAGDIDVVCGAAPADVLALVHDRG